MELHHSSKYHSEIMNQSGRRRIIVAGSVPGRNVSRDKSLTIALQAKVSL